MIDLDKTQKEVIDNKKNHGFKMELNQEFCLLYGEVAEAYEAYIKNKTKEELGLELADVAIYLLGICELCNISLGNEIEKKMEINKHRKYILKDGAYIKIDDRDEK